MNILYIGVHHHVGWGAEHWLANALERAGHRIGRFDYRARRKKFQPWWLIRHELFGISDTFQPDVVLIQRGERVPASITQIFNVPVIFWSTEPLVRRNDVYKLFRKDANIGWVFLHSNSCQSLVKKKYPHLQSYSSVLPNAGALENRTTNTDRSRFAIFNRVISPRRKRWLNEVGDAVEVVSGKCGEPYFEDLRTSTVSVNIHYADENVDDFETGIFEALASGCVVVTETLNRQTLVEMGMEDAVIQVESPTHMRETLLALKDDPERIKTYQRKGQDAIANNSWDSRAAVIMDKFSELLEKVSA